MTRRRVEPPLGLPRSPNFVKCERRKAELLAEFLRRFDYVLASFRMSRMQSDFNQSLARIKRSVKYGRQVPGRGERVAPSIEIIINHHANRFAQEHAGRRKAELIQDDVEKAAEWVARHVHPIRGRPRAGLLDHHVAGMMALIQQFTGVTVSASRHHGSGHYEPRLNDAARILLHLREVDPTITETQLVNKVNQMRRKYAGKVMRFRDFYPLYGASLGSDGAPIVTLPFRLECFERSVPIYCP